MPEPPQAIARDASIGSSPTAEDVPIGSGGAAEDVSIGSSGAAEDVPIGGSTAAEDVPWSTEAVPRSAEWWHWRYFRRHPDLRPQLRRVAWDGKAYTQEEFGEFYGPEEGLERWELATWEKVEEAELRAGPDGWVYTLAEFVEHYGASFALVKWREAVADASPVVCAEACSPHVVQACNGCSGALHDSGATGRGTYVGSSYCADCWDVWLAAIAEPEAGGASCSQPSATLDLDLVGPGDTLEDGSGGCEEQRKARKALIDALARCDLEAAEVEKKKLDAVARHGQGASSVKRARLELASLARPPPTPARASLPRKAASAKHFDFVEVGTSDWGTVTQFCAGCEGAVWLASQLALEIRTSKDDLRLARGLAVEAVREHLEALPCLPHVQKVEAAMDEIGGEDTFHYVSAENIERHMGKYKVRLQGLPPDRDDIDVMWYAKSLSSLGSPHPDLVWMMREADCLHLLESRRVQVISWGELCAVYNIGSVDVVQLDCEGKDCAILRGLLAHCDVHPAALPRVIQFEANHLTKTSEVDDMLAALQSRGYKVRIHSQENVMVERL